MCRAESTCTGLLKYSPHSPGNYSRSGLSSSACLFLSVSWQCVSKCLSSFCLFLVLLISLPQFSTSPVTPSTTSLSSSFFAHCVSITFLCCFLPPYLHYHSPHPHLSIPLLSPVRLEWKITEIPSQLSWIGYADVTDTTAPHKYTAYYLPLLQHTYEALPSSRLTSRLHKEYGIFAATEICATPQQIYANQFILFTCAGCHPRLSVCLWEETVRNCCSFSQPQLKQTRAVCSHSSLFFSVFTASDCDSDFLRLCLLYSLSLCLSLDSSGLSQRDL